MPRKADSLAGRGSMADRLRRRRDAVESGDPTGGMQEEVDPNSDDSVGDRGYDLPEKQKKNET